MGLASILKSRLIPAELENHINRIRKPIGSLGYDPWGYNNEVMKYGFSLTRQIYEKYFRVEATGVDKIPSEGPVLIVPNHSGQLPVDGLLIPYLGNLLNEFGAVLGDPTNCAKMLANGEAVIVFPEGIRGSGKLYQDRYQLKRFGNGFMHLAMKYKAPIVPVGVVGCEETIPAIANIKPLARWLGIPYAPVAMPFVLPAKVHLNFGDPMVFDDLEIPEEQVTERVEQVKAAISELIDTGLSERKRLF